MGAASAPESKRTPILNLLPALDEQATAAELPKEFTTEPTRFP